MILWKQSASQAAGSMPPGLAVLVGFRFTCQCPIRTHSSCSIVSPVNLAQRIRNTYKNKDAAVPTRPKADRDSSTNLLGPPPLLPSTQTETPSQPRQPSPINLPPQPLQTEPHNPPPSNLPSTKNAQRNHHHCPSLSPRTLRSFPTPWTPQNVPHIRPFSPRQNTQNSTTHSRGRTARDRQA